MCLQIQIHKNKYRNLCAHSKFCCDGLSPWQAAPLNHRNANTAKLMFLQIQIHIVYYTRTNTDPVAIDLVQNKLGLWTKDWVMRTSIAGLRNIWIQSPLIPDDDESENTFAGVWNLNFSTNC